MSCPGPAGTGLERRVGRPVAQPAGRPERLGGELRRAVDPGQREQARIGLLGRQAGGRRWQDAVRRGASDDRGDGSRVFPVMWLVAGRKVPGYPFTEHTRPQGEHLPYFGRRGPAVSPRPHAALRSRGGMVSDIQRVSSRYSRWRPRSDSRAARPEPRSRSAAPRPPVPSQRRLRPSAAASGGAHYRPGAPRPRPQPRSRRPSCRRPRRQPPRRIPATCSTMRPPRR